MPAALSVDSFAELVQRSRLLSADQVQQVLQELEAEGKPADTPQALADALVRREMLTSWQVGFLLKGKHNGFFLGSYRFLKMLGKGGMGAVYLAEHQMMRRRCAIKVLPSKLVHDSSSVLDRFYLEAQAVAALDDPNIVRAYDVNKEMQGKREIHYLVMEYVDGCDLQVLVQRKGPLGFIQVADFARQAASGLSHAHESGLIHRDIKPANLLIDERGTVKILDLGLARFFDDRLDASLTTTHNESILGTADYLSPEQALDSHNVDTRTDIYSLGCTCYFMLTGHPPFPEGSVAQRLMSHQAKSPKAIEKIRPDTPTDLITIVEKMIAKSADNRYQTAREVADAFTKWLTKNADDDWKRAHREMIEGSVSHIRREPTRARSAAMEETNLELGDAMTEELGLAPLDQDTSTGTSAETQVAKPNIAPTTSTDSELGLDQLEELDSLPTNIDSGSSSGSLDNLLNEALDNYPALDSNPNLALASQQAGSISGIHQNALPVPASSAESNQLLKLILIGFAVSVPLSIVILVVSSQFERPAEAPSVALSPEVFELEAPIAGHSTESAPPTGESPETPIEDNTQTSTPASEEAAPENTDTGEPPSTREPPTPSTSDLTRPTTEPDAAEPEKMASGTPPGTVGAAMSASGTEAQPDPATNKLATPPNDTTPTPPAGQIAETSDAPEADATEPPPLSTEQKKQLLASLTEVTVRLDRELDKKTYAYDLMVLKTAQESLERAGLKVSSESQDASSAVLSVSFDAERAGAGVVFHLSAQLIFLDENSNEIVLWKQREDIGPMSASVLGPTPPSVLRNKVSGFYNAVTREYRRAAADSD